jgi:hypothetical protein
MSLHSGRKKSSIKKIFTQFNDFVRKIKARKKEVVNGPSS